VSRTDVLDPANQTDSCLFHRQAVSSTGDDSVMRATMRALLSFKPKDPKQSSENVALIRWVSI
jgi:hypothetical protein